MRTLETILLSLGCGALGAVAVGFGAMFVADVISPNPPGGHGGPGNVILLFLGAQVGFVLGLVGSGVALGKADARRRERLRARRSEDDFDDREEFRS